MLEIIIYAFGIMYSPGPANTLALFAGVSGQGWKAFPYCVGVGLAMLLYFLLIGYLGSYVTLQDYQAVISVLGGLYIAYLSVKIMRSSFEKGEQKAKVIDVNFKMGLILQLCNPKALVAILPIVTVQFPREGIEGVSIILWSLLLSFLACGAPGLYLLIGSRLKKVAMHSNMMAWVSRLMSLLLLFVAYRFIFF